MRPRMWQCTSGSWRYGGCSSPKRCRPRRRVSGSSWDGPGRRPEARSAAGSVRQVGAAAKRMLKEIAYWVLILSGLSWVAARPNRRKALVLLYHVVDAGTLHPVMNFDGLHVRRDLFERQMRHLAAHYHVVTLDALLNSGAGAAGNPLAAITFDDGYRNLHRHAYPELKRLALPGTILVISHYLQYSPARWSEPMW